VVVGILKELVKLDHGNVEIVMKYYQEQNMKHYIKFGLKEHHLK